MIWQIYNVYGTKTRKQHGINDNVINYNNLRHWTRPRITAHILSRIILPWGLNPRPTEYYYFSSAPFPVYHVRNKRIEFFFFLLFSTW